MNINELVDAVKTHALKNYNQGGWDFVIECHSTDEIRQAIGKATTEAGAIKNVAQAFAIALHDEIRTSHNMEAERGR